MDLTAGQKRKLHDGESEERKKAREDLEEATDYVDTVMAQPALVVEPSSQASHSTQEYSNQGASECNQCAKGTKNDACNNNTFTSNYTEDSTLCTNVKGDSSLVSALCNSFPNGYKVVCDAPTNGTQPVCEDTCSAAAPSGINKLTPVMLAVFIILIITQ